MEINMIKIVNLIISWLASTIAVWLALKVFPGKQKKETFSGAGITTIIGAIIFWVFGILDIPLGTVIALIVWLYALRRIQGVGWLGALALAIIIWIINAVFSLLLPTLL